jgi:low temperature requirement protein LtrA
MAFKDLFQIPRLRKDQDEEKHRKTTWLELFFDLFFVVVIAQLSTHLVHKISWPGVLEFVLLFIPVWRVWIGMTYYNERFETEGLEIRIFTFLIMIPVAFLAIFSRHGLGIAFEGFVLSYAFARFFILVLWILGGLHNSKFAPVSKRFFIGFSISIAIAVSSVAFNKYLNYIFFGLAVLIDMVTPLFTYKQQARLPKISITKLPERFGLFVIIVLGETVIGVVQGLSNISNPTIKMAIPGVMGIALTFGIWWLYFDYIGKRPFKFGKLWRFGWSYLHLPMLMGIVGLGVGIMNIEANIDTDLQRNQQLLIAGSLGITLLFIGLLEMTLRPDEQSPVNRVVSPLLKIISGIVSFLTGITGIFNNAVNLLIIMLVLIFMHVLYGIFVWQKQASKNDNKIKRINHLDDENLV